MDYSAFGIFLLTVGFISLSGVMMPGPVMVAAIAKGSEDKHAGLWIAIGHLMVEIPLIAFIAMGFYYILTDNWIQGIIGIAGGILLVQMGYKMVKMRKKKKVVKKSFPGHPVLAGIVTTGGNPYFILWWATVGSALIIAALEFGWVGILGFVIIHETCDILWDWFLSYSVHSSKEKWTRKTHAAVFGTCGAILIIFGIYFVLAFWL